MNISQKKIDKTISKLDLQIEKSLVNDDMSGSVLTLEFLNNLG